MKPDRQQLDDALRKLDERIDRARKLSQKRRFGQAVQGPQHAVWILPWMVAGAAATLLVVWMAVPEAPAPTPPALAGIAARADVQEAPQLQESLQAPEESAEAPHRERVVLARGVNMTLNAGTKARGRRVGRRQIQVSLEDGRVDLDMGAPVVRRMSWVILAGEYRVQAKSAEISVSYEAASRALRLKVNHGRATLYAPGMAPRRVDAGGELNSVVDTSSVSKREPRAANKESDWKTLYERGLYADAWEAAYRSGLPANQGTLNAPDLSALADVARLARAANDARSLLLAVRDRYPDSPDAREAAFLLGRLATDSQSDGKAAEDWFSTYLRESPSGTYAQEALGRLLTLASRGRDQIAAKQLAERYLSKYPGGPYASLARTITH